MTKELKILIFLVLLGAGLILGFKYLFPLIAPFLLGITFACLIEPLVRKLENIFKIGRNWAISFVLVFLLLIIFSFTGLTIMAFYQEAVRLLPRVSVLVGILLRLIETWLNSLAHYFPLINEGINNFSLNPESLERIFRSLIKWMMNFLPNLPQIILAIGLGGITAYFVGKDKKLISRLFYRNLPKSWQSAAVQIKDEFMTTLARFIRAELSLVFITGLMTTVIFYGLGIPGAAAYGFLTGVLDFLPVVGPGMIYIPFVVVCLIFKNYYLALFLGGAYFLVLLVRQVAEVKLIGDNLHLHPLLTIFIIYVGMKIFGFAGIFFGPVLMITLRAFHRALVVIWE